MLFSNDYEVLSIVAPNKGMNQDVAPELLGNQAAFFVQNAFNSIEGLLTPRFGTLLRKSFSGASQYPYQIMEAFSYPADNNNTQYIIYIQTYNVLPNILYLYIVNSKTLRIDDPEIGDFVENTSIGFVTPTGTLFFKILSITSFNEVASDLVLEGIDFTQDIDIESVTAILYSTAIIRIYDVATDSILNGANQLMNNLSPACVPRGDYFDGIQFICNGVDNIMTWDGQQLIVYQEQIKEQAANSFVRQDNNHFSFRVPIIDQTNYQNKSIVLQVNGVETSLTVTNVVVTDVNNVKNVALTVVENLPAFGGQDRLEVFFFKNLPLFSLMKVTNQNIHCLGAGPVSLEYRSPDQAMRVYYANNFSDTFERLKFFNEVTQVVPSVNLAVHNNLPDNLEAICELNNQLIIFGRHSLYVWNQTIEVGNFVKTLPLGIIHGNLWQAVGNDIIFASPNGPKSLNTINISNQIVEGSVSGMDTVFKQYYNSITSDEAYRACRSFTYDAGNFGGFKIGHNNIIGFEYGSSLSLWNILAGDFERASSFLSTSKDGLYLFIKDGIYQYGDGRYGQIAYADNNNQDVITCIYSRYFDYGNRVWSNNRFCVNANYSSSIVLNKNNNLNVCVNGKSGYTFSINKDYKLPLRGDLFNTVPFVSSNTNNPDNIEADALGFRFDIDNNLPTQRLKFTSSKFWVSVSFEVANGPFSLRDVSFYGSLGK